jgi:dolichyl-diphosphooligosaccharide--protein glycosyltransferase
MKLSDALSKERIINRLKGISKLRIKASHGSILGFSALLLILFVAFTIRVLPIRWEIEVGTLHLSEFDPYFEYRFAEYLWKNGFISWAWPTQWVDTQRWYPYGINVATEGFFALPFTTAVLYDIVTALGVNIQLMDLAAILPPIFAMLACLVTYWLGKDIGGKPVGMLAALFVALSATHISRTALGMFKEEVIAVLSIPLVSLLFLRAIEEDRPIDSTIKYALGAGLFLGYVAVGWGGAYYIVDLIALFAFVLILLKRSTQRLLLSYSLTFGLGLFIAVAIPKPGPIYLTEGVILPVAGVFALLCLIEVVHSLTSAKAKVLFTIILLSTLVFGFSVLWLSGHLLGIAGKFLSVIDPWGREINPLIESVAEHKITSWASMYYDFGIGILFFIMGLFFISRNLNNKNLYLLIFGLTTLYFGSSMIRLLELMAPAFGLVAATGVVGILKPFIVLLKEPPKISIKKKYGLSHVSKEFSGVAIFLIFLVLVTDLAFPMPKVYKQAYTPVTVTAASIPITPSGPIHEWLDMLQWIRNNLDANTVVCSWWDYGYWLTVLGNVTTLTDNATINDTQIQNTGFIFMATETQAMRMLETYNAKYLLVFVTVGLSQPTTGTYVGSLVGYGDEGKWTWMARISGQAQQRFINDGWLPDEESSWVNESTFGAYNTTNNAWIWNDVGMNTTIYKLMSWAKQRWCDTNGITPDATGVQPTYFKEVYFAGVNLSPDTAASEYGAAIVPLVCLYKIDWDKYRQDTGY